MPNGNPAPGPLNSRYFRPVRGKETRARRWDLQFESTSLQRRVRRTSNSFSRLSPARSLTISSWPEIWSVLLQLATHQVVGQDLRTETSVPTRTP
jgi:hypothetical protein